MFATGRMLPRALLSLLLLASLNLQAAPAEDAARALHLLGYLGADYPATVSAGQVVDASEYREQQEFVGVLQGLLDGLPANQAKAGLQQGVAGLAAAIEQRADGARVASLARSLSASLAQAYQVSLSPPRNPDPARGAPLYAEHCSVCHGSTGAGDGPAGAGLQPPPSNLRDATRLDRLSLYDLFNTLGQGVEGTGMQSFADRLDEAQRWDLASYIAGFSADPAAAGRSFELAELAGRTPLEIATQQGSEAAAAFRAQRAHPAPPQRSPQQLIAFARTTLERSLAAYRDGQTEQAYELSVTAYLEGFELVEGALNNLDPQQRKATEKALMAYRQRLQNGVAPAQAEQALQAAVEALGQSAEVLAGGGMSASLSFISSLLILLREGVEAILVLAAILAFLGKTGQMHAARSVHLGWGLALLAGVATWAAAAWLLDIGGAQRELLEGATALFASLMLLWLGVWMHSRRHADAWQHYLQQSLLGSSGRLGFAVLAFIAVYRELFEVILFYETLWLQAGPAGQPWVLSGALAAVAGLLVLAWVILRGAARLPLGTFFSANALLMCALAVVFAGHGVVALQEAGYLPLAPQPFVEIDWLGVHPDRYSLAAQALVLLAIGLFYGRDWWLARRRQALATE